MSNEIRFINVFLLLFLCLLYFIKEWIIITILIKNGRIIDPLTNTDKVMDILVENNVIQEISKTIDIDADKVIDASNKWVVPGFIDLHVHLREPGFEYKETIETGSKSAAKGGFTTICCMPNTKPVTDSKMVVEYIKLKAEKEACINVLPIGSITKAQKGEEISDIGDMVKAGICAISEDGKSVKNSLLLKQAMFIAKEYSIPVMSHCEDIDLVQKGAMNESEYSKTLGIRGISNASEEVIEARDIILAKETQAHLHLCHVSTEGGIELIKEAKQRNLNVTAEVCPHHFTLTDSMVTKDNTNMKMNPPLRSANDVEALKKALENGIIDVIATDHAPHSVEDKNKDFENAAFGIVGLETAFPLAFTELVYKGYLTPSQLIEKMSTNPAKILGIDKGSLKRGKVADITIIDPDAEYEININEFVSKSKNSPFDGYKVRGKILYTIVGGKIIVEDGELNDN